MRIDALHLDAVGPFTGRRLDLAAGTHGVHVIHGRNEAGKSSSLRALRALLFGFHPQTPDNFVHDYKDLRVGAVLRARDGGTLTVCRRKGKKNTLLDASGKPLGDDAIAPLMAGVDEMLFARLFGIDHAALVSGGEALVREHGREAEALFGSGLGSNVVHDVRKGLDEEAAALFSPRASKPELNALLAELEQVRRAERDASLAASRWDEARRAADRARKELDVVETELAAARARSTALARLRATLPNLAERRRLLEELAALGDVPDLAPDFGARRDDAEQRARSAGERLELATAQLARLDEEMSPLVPERSLLDEEDAIEALVKRLAVHGKAAADRTGLRDRRVRIAAELGALQARPGIAGLDAVALRAALGRRGRAEELAAQKEAREQAVRDAVRQLEERRADLKARERKRDALPPAADPGALRAAVSAARKAGDLDARLDVMVAAQAHAARECADALAALGRWQGSADALLGAPLPESVSLERFAERFAERDEQVRRIEAARAESKARRDGAEEALRALAVGGEVPSVEALTAARAHRDAGWALLRARWVDGRDVDEEAARYAADAPLPDAFEGAVRAADGVADRLRTDAERVQARDTRIAERAAALRALAAADAEAAEAAASATALDQAWLGLWQPCGVEPGTVREMAAWLQRAERLRDRLRQARAADAERAAAEQSRAIHVARLCDALGEPLPGAHGDLAPVLARAEQRLAALEDIERQRAALEEAIGSLRDGLEALESRHREAEQALATWGEAWSVLTGALGLPATYTPGEVSDHFTALQEVNALGREDAELARREAGIDEDARRFAADAKALCERVAPDLASRAPESAVGELNVRLRRQLKVKERLDALREQAEAARRDLEAARVEQGIAAGDLAALGREAGGVAREALADLVRRDQRHKVLRAQLDKVARALVELGDGQAPEALAAAAQGVDADAARAEHDALVQRIDEVLEPRRRELAERAVNAARDFADMAGGDDAAAHEERAQQLLAEIRAGAERYVRVRLAAKVLADQLEQFRARHRDPILTAAGGYLATLTRGAFTAVDTELDAADEPVLCAVREGGERLRVEGLSTGTRDQLYLALRLATLDHYLSGAAEPLPFVVDDVLVQFDDERAGAALEALAHFSTRTQVLLFTHHARIAEDARALAGEGGGVFVHEL